MYVRTEVKEMNVVEYLFFMLMAFLVLSFFLFFILGGYVVFLSPIIFELDRDKDLFSKKTKYFWQKEYRTKFQCPLSDVMNVHHNPVWWFNRLYLMVRSYPSKILLFQCIDLGLWHMGTGDISFIETKVKINNFLRHKEEKTAIISFSLSELGGYILLFVSMIMCYIIMVIVSFG